MVLLMHGQPAWSYLYRHMIPLLVTQGYRVYAADLIGFGGSIDDARKAIEENYSGCYRSLADYAAELTEDTIQIPENLAYYIDYDVWGAIWSWTVMFTPSKRPTMRCMFSGVTDRNGR